MNSLNILSSRVIGPAPSPRTRSYPQEDSRPSTPGDDIPQQPSFTDYTVSTRSDEASGNSDFEKSGTLARDSGDTFDDDNVNEKTALISDPGSYESKKSTSRRVLKALIAAITEGARYVLSYVGAPAFYVIACFKDSDGRYSAIMPAKKVANLMKGSKVTKKQKRGGPGSRLSDPEKDAIRQRARKSRASTSSEMSSPATSDSEIEKRYQQGKGKLKPDRRTSAESNQPTRRSIRIKLNSNESFQERRKQRTAKAEAANARPPPSEGQLTVDNIKSPTSPSSLKITKYPHSPAPPRPLVPRRQPSYTASSLPASSRRSSLLRSSPAHLQQQKTLILDLDETLIHSLAKGGRMSSGHMVEVKLNAPVGIPGSGVIGPQHPILYYVHKRPHCDDFLRKVCKWYKLVIFTASVQEYADPVIDWLEQERKFFSGRYYRQHCTFRNGAYIKDLSSVEPDLSRVCILDNSPMSYIFHEGMLAGRLKTRPLSRVGRLIGHDYR